MKVTKEQFIGMTYDELLAENEKLWALNEHMGLKDMAVIGGLEKENERLKSDNDRLRELVEDMHAALQAFCDAQDVHGDNCPLWVERTDDCELRGIERRMRELRVGVDA